MYGKREIEIEISVSRISINRLSIHDFLSVSVGTRIIIIIRKVTDNIYSSTST